MKKLTTKLFIEKSKNIHDNKYNYDKVSYINNLTPVIITCKIHQDFKQKPIHHLRGQGCKKCGLNVYKKTTNQEKFIEKANKVHQNKYDYSNTIYLKAKEKINIICPKHGEFNQTADSHLRGNGCYQCGLLSTKTNITYSNEEFIFKSKQIHGNKYDYSQSIYINFETKIKIICLIHGEFEQKAGNHLKGFGCKKCSAIKTSKKLSYTTDIFIKKAKKIHQDKYDYSKTKYINNKNDVLVSCKKHGEFFQKPFNHLAGKGCTLCSESKGESLIRKYLIDHNIEYIKQYTFINCKNIKPLPFDFYLPKLNICIEFDGIQHFEPSNYFGGNIGYIKRKINDNIKNKYCQENKIKMLRISYKDILSINDKLSQFLLECG